MRASGQHLADGGRCVLVSTSLTGVVPGPYGLYAAAKAGVEVMVRATAAEWGGRGITVNAVAPGPIDNAFFRGPESTESITAAATFSPQSRLGRAGDVASVVGFLLSDASGWVSGQTLRANGGMVQHVPPSASWSQPQLNGRELRPHIFRVRDRAPYHSPGR